MAMKHLNIEATRRLSVGLLAAAGALMFAAFDLIGAGISANDRAFAAEVSGSLGLLSACLVAGLSAFIMTEIAAHPGTPDEGHPHSKRNYLESALTLVAITGLTMLVLGAGRLILAATIKI